MPISINGSTGISGVDGSAGTPALQGSDSNTGIAFGADTIIGSTGGSERFRVDSSGRLGIGTTSAQAVLHAKTGNVTSAAQFETASNSGAFISFADNVSSSFTDVQVGCVGTSYVMRTGAAERARIDSSGRLLIGTSSSSLATKIHVQGSTSPTNATAYDGPVVVTDGATDHVALYAHNSSATSTTSGTVTIKLAPGGNGQYRSQIVAGRDGNYSNSTSSTSNLQFWTSGGGGDSSVERMRITSDGYVGIGATARLGNGGIFFRNNVSAGAGEISFNRADTASTSTVMAFHNNSNSVGAITHTNTTTAFNTSSDYRLKENIAPVTNGINRLQQLKPSRFNFIADPNKTVDGFIAHEVQEVVPEAIHGEKDAVDEDGNPIYQGIDQSKLVPLLTAALQEAIAKIESLETRLAALEVTP